MKKIIAIIMVLCLSLVLMVGCGGTDGGNTDNGNGGTTASAPATDKKTQTKAASDLCKSDKQMLQDNGYSVYDYNSTFYAQNVEGDIGAESGSLAAYLDAYENADGHQITVYYFLTEAQAQACLSGKDSSYKVVGIRLVCNDTKNVIK